MEGTQRGAAGTFTSVEAALWTLAGTSCIEGRTLNEGFTANNEGTDEDEESLVTGISKGEKDGY